MELIDGGVQADIISLKALRDEVEALKKASEYHAGDSITCDQIIADGFITSGTTQANFFIPVAKPIGSDVKTVTIKGSFMFRQNGKYISDASTYYGFNTSNGMDAVDSFNSQGINFHVCMAGSVAFPNMTNNDCVSANLKNLQIDFA